MVKYKELRYVVKEYKHGWSLWIQRDGRKVMIGSAIKSEDELNELVNSIGIEKEYYREKVDLEKEQLKKKVEELQKYKEIVDLIELSKITAVL